MSELSRKLIDLIREEVDEEALKKERSEGLSQGISQGLSQGLTRTARAMLRDNMDVQLVSRYTSLPVEEVEHMKAEAGA